MSLSSTRLKILQLDKHNGVEDDTRSRLIEEAGAIFAERGYQAATTREICVRARANAAAVNYHFGDKLGLYKATLKWVIARQDSAVESSVLSAMSPEQALHYFIEAMCNNLATQGAVDPYTGIMAHELSDPTPGLAVVVNQIIAPRARLLMGIVARLTKGSSTSVQTRLAAHSIMAQVVHYMHARPVIKLLWPKWQMNAGVRRQIVDHVTSFSLAGLKQMAVHRPRRENKGARQRGSHKPRRSKMGFS